MAETRKTTTKTAKTKTTKSTKTVPAKKPATKPAGKSVKPKATKTVSASAKPKATSTKAKTTAARTNSAKPKSAKKDKNGAKTIMIIIIIVAALAVVAGVAACVINKCFNNDIVMIENGNGKQIEAKRVGLEGYNYTIAVPTDFHALTAEEIKKDYGTSEAPDAAYANSDNTVNIVFSKPENNLTNDQIEEYLKAMKLILSTSMDVIDTNSYEVDGHNVGVIRVSATTDGQKVYNQMAFFSYNDKLAIVSFNCKDEVRGEWEKAGENIIKTLEIK